MMTLWFLPLGAEPVGRDGNQLFYGDTDGLGSATALPVVGHELVAAGIDALEDPQPTSD